MKQAVELLNEYLRLKQEKENFEEEYNNKTDKIEERILKLYGLPKKVDAVQDPLYVHSFSDADSHIERIVAKLENFAIHYIESTPETDIQLLENSKAKGLKAVLALQLIGVNNNHYPDFIYDHIFLKGLESAENTLSILKDDTLYEGVEMVVFYITEADQRLKEVNVDSIKYFKEFLKFETARSDEFYKGYGNETPLNP